MQCKWCVIRVVVNDMKYYCFRGENLKGLDNNHTQNSFFAFSYPQHFYIFGTSPNRFRILHLVVKSFTHQLFDFMELTLWNMVWKKIINGYYSNTFYFAMTNKNQAVVSCLRTSIHKATTVFGCEDADLQVLMSIYLCACYQFEILLHSKVSKGFPRFRKVTQGSKEFHVLTCSSISLHAVPWACMQLHNKLACSSLSLHAAP